MEPGSFRPRDVARAVPLRQRLSDSGARASGYVCKTHKTSQTAFRGFGGPQGMIVIEDILDRIARTLGLRPDAVRERNFYREGDVTHYGQPVKDASRIERIWDELKRSSDFENRRRRRSRAFNAAHEFTKRGIAITPGEVRHLVHGDVLQSGGRAGAGVSRRQRAGESWRRRDGTGAAYEDPADCGGCAGRAGWRRFA